MPDDNRLGDYLRARRDLVTPGSVGLPAAGVRRVAGLRREEVALLAGISSDYYLRLEQGRDRNPSVQVLDSLARALRLDQAGTDYLRRLAAPPRRPRRRHRRDVVPAGITLLLGTLALPAFVEGRYFDVLAANSLARALSPTMVAGRNRLRAVFLDPEERELYPDWERVTARHVAAFRASVGTDTEDAGVVDLVGELSKRSDRFRRLWARQDVHVRAGMPIDIRHPQLGGFTVYCEKLAIGGAPGETLVLYHAEPGSADAEKLGLLSALVDDAEQPGAPATPAAQAASAAPGAVPSRA